MSYRIKDAEEVCEFLLYRMTLDQRSAMMSERPLLYARLFPSVPAECILAKVKAALNKEVVDSDPL